MELKQERPVIYLPTGEKVEVELTPEEKKEISRFMLLWRSIAWPQVITNVVSGCLTGFFTALTTALITKRVLETLEKPKTQTGFYTAGVPKRHRAR